MKTSEHTEDNLKEMYSEHLNTNHLDSIINILYHKFLHPSINALVHLCVCETSE